MFSSSTKEKSLIMNKYDIYWRWTDEYIKENKQTYGKYWPGDRTWRSDGTIIALDNADAAEEYFASRSPRYKSLIEVKPVPLQNEVFAYQEPKEASVISLGKEE